MQLLKELIRKEQRERMIAARISFYPIVNIRKKMIDWRICLSAKSTELHSLLPGSLMCQLACSPVLWCTCLSSLVRWSSGVHSSTITAVVWSI